MYDSENESKMFMTCSYRPSTGESAGADPGGGAPGARPPPPPKIGKKLFFWRKIVIFHTKYPKNVRTSLRNWKKYDFLA